MKNHLKASDITVLKCDMCDGSFKNSKTLNKHVKTVHEGINKCNICFKVFGFVTDLKRHFDSVHERTEMFQCDQCKKDFKYENVNSLKKKHTTKWSLILQLLKLRATN